MRQDYASIKTGILTILSSILLSTVACDKKDNNSQVPINPYGAYGQGCLNCFANPNIAAQGMKSYTGTYSGMFTLDLLIGQGQGNFMNGGGYNQGYGVSNGFNSGYLPGYNTGYGNGYGGPQMNMQSPVMLETYAGPAALQGFLDIQYSSPTFCYLMPGRYNVMTVQAGMMNMKTLYGISLTMTGPGGQVHGTVVSAQLANQFASFSGGTSGIAMSLRLDSVNGYPCGYVQTAQY